jgi:hypothetical protein
VWAENCFRKIMDNKKGNAGKKRSPDSDEGIGSSFDSDSSSSGTKDNKERVECDSSPETVNISVFFSEPIAHFSLVSIDRSMDVPCISSNVKVLDFSSGDCE